MKKETWLNNFIQKYRKALLSLGGIFCPNCGDKLDYNHIGYKGDRGYCHDCGFRSDSYEVRQ